MREYSVDLQRLFLEMMLADGQSYVRVQNIFNPDNFDKSLKQTAKFIQEHAEKHSVLPKLSQVNAVSLVKLGPVDDLDERHYDWFLEEFEMFTKRQELERAILKSADLIEKGTFDPVEKLIKDAVQISLTKDLGLDYWNDPKQRLQDLKEGNGQVSTGWQNLDRKLFGGFNKGELNIFAGGSGSGKSLFMQNLSVNWCEAGLNGVYITLELSEGLTAMRLDSMNADIASREIFKSLEEVELKIKMKSKKSGKFWIKYMPAQSNVNDIRAYIKELQIKTGIKLDFIMIDYLDLLMPVSAKVSPNDQFIKDKYVSEELRNLAKEIGLLLVTASQLNRCLTGDTICETPTGYKQLKDLQPGDQIRGTNGYVTIKNKISQVQRVHEIKTESGKTIRASSAHKFPTDSGLKHVGELCPGDSLFVDDSKNSS